MQEINLYHLLKYYVQKWRIILAFTLFGLLGGLVYNSFIQTPLYESNTKLILVSSKENLTASDQTLINNYVSLIQSRRVLEPVIVKHEIDISYEDLSNYVTATNKENTEVIEVIVATPDAEQSKLIANSITNSFKTAVTSLYGNDNVVVVDPAVVATEPSNVNKGMQLALATVAGLMLSVIVLFFIYDAKQMKVERMRKKQTHQVPGNNPQYTKKPNKKHRSKNFKNENATKQ